MAEDRESELRKEPWQSREILKQWRDLAEEAGLSVGRRDDIWWGLGLVEFTRQDDGLVICLEVERKRDPPVKGGAASGKSWYDLPPSDRFTESTSLTIEIRPQHLLKLPGFRWNPDEEDPAFEREIRNIKRKEAIIAEIRRAERMMYPLRSLMDAINAIMGAENETP